MSEFILAIDQGTTGSTALLVDAAGHVRARGYAELPQHFPRPGWVEHDGDEIWRSVQDAVGGALSHAGVEGNAVGIEAVGVHEHLQLPVALAPDGDVRHAGHGHEARAHRP